ncbi:MAG: PAS domain S-box protein [Steroidobacteraceae bacterium]
MAESSASARAARLEWLLKGVLEVQSLVTQQEFDLGTFMQRVVDLAADLTGAKGAVVELAEGDDMVYRSASESLREHVGLRVPRARSLSGLCVTDARVLLCEDTEHDERVNTEACRAVGVRSMICTPLFDAGRAMGVLKVVAGDPNAFDTDDEYLLGLLAGALGSALARQLTLDALKTSEETFRAAMETAPIGNALVKPDGRFLKVNAALCHLLGYSEEELLANDIHSITHAEDRERDLEYAQRTLAGEIEGYRFEKRFYHRSGRTVWTQLSVSLVRDRAGQPNYFVSQIQDISEQREMERVKSEFISIVSHELRTPLTSIRGSLGLVLGTHADAMPASAQRLLAIANNNCERLILLINDILDIDKIASGNMRFDMQERDLTDILHKAVQATEAYAQRFNVGLALDAPAHDVRLVVDEDRLLQVLTNLLSNAVKFSPPDDLVTLSTDSGERYVQLRVTDRGSGIPDEFRDRIFERFSQADSSTARRAGGTGLGLHISRQIVERMHGRIGFDSEAGRGTTFWIEFPRAAQSTTIAVESTVPDNPLPHILHVENDCDLAEVLRTSLHGVAHPVLATTLAQARRLLSVRSFALVLLDVCLPDGSGLDLLGEIEAMGEQAPPVIVLCADTPSRDLQGRVAAVMIKTRMPERMVVEGIERILQQQRNSSAANSPQ